MVYLAASPAIALRPATPMAPGLRPARLILVSGGSPSAAALHALAALPGLHNDKDAKVFDTGIVITDRLVLDQQLQDTIYQLEHKKGVVEKIDEDTQQLARALANRVPIVISTIQKFPFIANAINTMAKKGDKVAIETAGKCFAVIVGILNKEGIEAAVAAQILDEEDDSGLTAEARTNMLRDMAKRPRQPNLSYFALTATPKFKTKAIFDEPGDDGRSPFHLYSMRQAIQEGFIMDVLAHYTTFKSLPLHHFRGADTVDSPRLSRAAKCPYRQEYRQNPRLLKDLRLLRSVFAASMRCTR
jgi:type I restriction enzyme R subunit